LIGAFAAVGAAMLAGLQLTGLGKLNGLELVGAVLAVVIAVVCTSAWRSPSTSAPES
jgi:hypothetical protein